MPRIWKLVRDEENEISKEGGERVERFVLDDDETEEKVWVEKGQNQRVYLEVINPISYSCS